jgi:Helitron helicase-like domain at N-terminus
MPGQNAHDRPDITNCVCKMKMDQMIQMIKNRLFYNVKAHCHSVEWQKHGLTHCHLIVWFDLPIGFEFTPHFIDSMNSEELPPLGSFLREMIEKCNIHTWSM